MHSAVSPYLGAASAGPASSCQLCQVVRLSSSTRPSLDIYNLTVNITVCAHLSLFLSLCVA